MSYVCLCVEQEDLIRDKRQRVYRILNGTKRTFEQYGSFKETGTTKKLTIRIANENLTFTGHIEGKGSSGETVSLCKWMAEQGQRVMVMG